MWPCFGRRHVCVSLGSWGLARWWFRQTLNTTPQFTSPTGMSELMIQALPNFSKFTSRRLKLTRSIRGWGCIWANPDQIFARCSDLGIHRSLWGAARPLLHFCWRSTSDLRTICYCSVVSTTITRARCVLLCWSQFPDRCCDNSCSKWSPRFPLKDHGAVGKLSVHTVH